MHIGTFVLKRIEQEESYSLFNLLEYDDKENSCCTIALQIWQHMS
jgi:hypothetical protein